MCFSWGKNSSSRRLSDLSKRIESVGTSSEGLSRKKMRLHTLLIRFSAQEWPKLVPSKFFVAVFPATKTSPCDDNFRHFSIFDDIYFLLVSNQMCFPFYELWSWIDIGAWCCWFLATKGRGQGQRDRWTGRWDNNTSLGLGGTIQTRNSSFDSFLLRQTRLMPAVNWPGWISSSCEGILSQWYHNIEIQSEKSWYIYWNHACWNHHSRTSLEYLRSCEPGNLRGNHTFLISDIFNN